MGLINKVVASFVFIGVLAFFISNGLGDYIQVDGVEAFNTTQPPEKLNKTIRDFETESDTTFETFAEPKEQGGNLYDEGLTKTSSADTGSVAYDISNIDKLRVYSTSSFLLPGCDITGTVTLEDASRETKNVCGTTTSDVSNYDSIRYDITSSDSHIYEIEFTQGQEAEVEDYAQFIFQLSSENQFVSFVIITPMIILFALLVAKLIPGVL